MNQFKTAVLLAVLTALFMWVGQLLGGQQGMVPALLMAGVMNLGAFWFSDKIVLAMYGGKEVSEEEAPQLFRAVSSLVQRMNLPMPRVYIIPMGVPNAFATGRNPHHAAVAVTAGILEMLSPEELEGVLAHELGHIQHRDTLISTVAATIAGALSYLANMAMWSMMARGRSSDDDRGGHPLGALLGIMIAPIAATLIQTAISRSREFLADSAGATATGNPMALASALKKIDAWAHRRPLQGGSPATAHMFIINPFSGGGMLKLFSTHPPTAERVRRLEEMAGQAQAPVVSFR